MLHQHATLLEVVVAVGQWPEPERREQTLEHRKVLRLFGEHELVVVRTGRSRARAPQHLRIHGARGDIGRIDFDPLGFVRERQGHRLTEHVAEHLERQRLVVADLLQQAVARRRERQRALHVMVARAVAGTGGLPAIRKCSVAPRA